MSLGGEVGCGRDSMYNEAPGCGAGCCGSRFVFEDVRGVKGGVKITSPVDEASSIGVKPVCEVVVDAADRGAAELEYMSVSEYGGGGRSASSTLTCRSFVLESIVRVCLS
jgi:hypothetical protein